MPAWRSSRRGSFRDAASPFFGRPRLRLGAFLDGSVRERLAAQSPAHKPGFNANLPEYLIVQLMPSSVAPTKTRRLAPTKSSNTHRAPHPARGFVPRRLSDAYRRPKLFTKAEWRLCTIEMLKRTFVLHTVVAARASR